MKQTDTLDRKILLRPDEVADVLAISRSQVYRLVDSGVLAPADRRIGPLRIPATEVRKLLVGTPPDEFS